MPEDPFDVNQGTGLSLASVLDIKRWNIKFIIVERLENLKLSYYAVYWAILLSVRL